jgi:hypothetical protein
LTTFTVKGPFAIATTKMKVGRSIGKADIEDFWSKYPVLATEKGCYIFGFKAAKGSKPIYVGKATKTFKQEIFTDHKLKKYSQAFGSQAKGTPILFFICANKTKGPTNKVAIDEAESHLIQAGLIANKNLLNDKKTSVESWSISGVIRSKGRASNQALALRKCLNIKS